MPSLSAQEIRRLAFSRLLYEQGVAQSRLPAPLNSASLLAFHDAVEVFLFLAADYLDAPLPRRDPNFLDYWQILRPTDTFAAGVDLSGQPAMDRLNRHRNALKHTGTFPGPEAAEEARAATAAFFEDNVPRVFGLDFAAVDMADVVPQDAAKAGLKAAAEAEAVGDRTEAMAQLAEAFRDLFTPYANSPYGSYAFGPTVDRPGGFAIGIESAMNTLAGALSGNARNHARGIAAIGRKADDRIAQLTAAAAALQRGMRVLALGIDYASYDRFQRLTPQVHFSGEHRQVQVGHGYAPTREEYDDCVQFVIVASLRLAEVEANAVEASWRPRWPE